MDENSDSQKVDNDKKIISIEDKLKKLQNAGLMSDVRDMMGVDENATSVIDNITPDEVLEDELSEILESTTPEPISVLNEALTIAPEETESQEEIDDSDDIDKDVDIESLGENIEEDEDFLSVSDSVGNQNDNELIEDEIINASVDSLSELILPKGSNIDIEELKFNHNRSHLDAIKKTDLPPEIESVWEMTIKNIITNEVIEEVEEIEPELTFYDKLVNKFTRRQFNVEEYSFVKHGPLLDFNMLDGANYKEIDLYPVNDPYAYIRIIYDPDLHEYKYQVIEPALSDKEYELLNTIKVRLTETLDVNLKNITHDNAYEYLKKHVNALLSDYRIILSPANREKIYYYIIRDFVGYGAIDAMMRDTRIEDISCDGPNTPIYIYHKQHESLPSTIEFHGDDELDSFVIRIAQVCGRHISISNPLLDATMPEGSRIQLTLGREVTTRGSTFTIRRFNEDPMTPSDLVNVHTFSTAMMAYMWLAVESSKSIVFAGGTASGKTTAMNAIALFIQPEMKIVSIEDTRELNLPHPNWIPGVTRESFAGESKGSIEMYELLRASLRQRPEYILVGEVRGAEAYVLFQAMSTGHTTFSTMHADSVQSIVHRLENPPINVPRIMMQALDIVAIQAQVKVGNERVRRCKSITEIVGVDTRTGELLTNEVFTWNAAKDAFQYSGRSYVVEGVMDMRGWDELKVRNELKMRQEVLEWTRIKEIDNYEDIAKIIVAYSREPQMIMKIVRQDLYG
ncbi:MAG: type II/IV secretion system ATPase subunit [Methanosarcinaceae archaeon]|nr:type II/IV secretion system ATPase subunit [Methanosarcinaceae archaeon]